jgi:drug/metabolite transporter (DMT)-like permease
MGEIAALATSVLWSATSIQFTLAGQRIGSEVVNRVRLALAVLLLALVHLVGYGRLLPADAGLSRWGWLSLSGVAGLMIGDGCLFQAFVLIGPRRSMLLMTLTPVISALLAWVWFGEVLRPVEVAAMLVTMAGVAWVVSERRTEQPAGETVRRRLALGVLLGLGGATGQALGLILSKQGMSGGYPALPATLIRMIASTVAIWLLTLVRGQLGTARHALRDKRAWGYLMGGVVTGPILGVWLSLVAVQQANVGIASTLMSLSPIVLLPLARWVFRERITPRAVAGTVVALVGASVLSIL